MIVASLIPLIPPLLTIISNLLQQTWPRSREANPELMRLKQSILDIQGFLLSADSEEIIDRDLCSRMNRALELLDYVEVTVDKFSRSQSGDNWGAHAILPDMFEKANFANEAKVVLQLVEKYIDQWTPATNRVSTGFLFTNHDYNIYSDGSDDRLVNIESARKQLVEWLAPTNATPSKSDVTQNGATPFPVTAVANRFKSILPFVTPTPKSDATQNDAMPKPVVLVVHGARGVGKTTLVGSVLRDATMRARFKYVLWMTGIKSCEGKENSFTQDEIENATAMKWKLPERESEQVTVRQLKSTILCEAKTKWLLVLDDLNRSDLFDSILNTLSIGTLSIIITTCDSRVASYCIGHSGFLFKLEILREVDARTLLVMEAFHGSPKEDFLKKFENVLGRILKLCNRLPLAIHAVSSLLRSENCEPSRWEEIIDMLGKKLMEGKDASLSIKRMITVPRYLPVDDRVLLYYLSIFPFDLPINCSEMMHLWMAEGFFEKSIQKDAAEGLKSLVSKSLIHVVKSADQRARICRVDNILHQVITWRSEHVGFTKVVAEASELLHNKVPTWRLSFSGEMKKGKKDVKKKKKDLKKEKEEMKAAGTALRNKPRSLLCFKGLHPDFTGELLKGTKMLKVFVLKDPYLTKFPKEIVELRDLKYLSLRNSNIQAIPSSIGNLTNLETLDLKGTPIAELPCSIKKLEKLRHLLVYESKDSSSSCIPTKFGFKAPSEIGTLTLLEKLCFMNVDSEQSKSILQELGKLTRLQRLGILNLREEDGNTLGSSIGELKNLEALHIVVAEEHAIDLSAFKILPCTLKRISLVRCVRSLPEWIPSVKGLKKLVLKGSRLEEGPSKDALDHLKSLDDLMHLELEEAFLIGTITFKAMEFKELRFLGVYKFRTLTSIEIDEGALPALQILSLSQCHSLQTLLPDITRPLKLRRIEHYSISAVLIQGIEQNAEIKDRVKIVPIEWKEEVVEISSVGTTNPLRWTPFRWGKAFQRFNGGKSANPKVRPL